MNGQILSLKCCQSLEQKLYEEADKDLFEEVLWTSVDQRAAKLQALKVGGLKKILHLSQSQNKRG